MVFLTFQQVNSQHCYGQTSSELSLIDLFCVRQKLITTTVSGKPICQNDYSVQIKVLIGNKLAHIWETSTKRVMWAIFTCRRAVGHGDVSGQVSGGVAAVKESRKRHDCGGTNTCRERTKIR